MRYAFFVLLVTATLNAQSRFVVTNTNDEGPGSLRGAIEEMNALCKLSCEITFEIPGRGPVHSIRLSRPLPRMRPGMVKIDGRTQTKFGGNTNPLGPEIELNGSALAEGNGLELCAGSVHGLTINGFPSNGVVGGGINVHGCAYFPIGGTISENYIGTDPTGTQAIPNTRGVWLLAERTGFEWYLEYGWSVTNNVVSGNRYSGVFVALGTALVENNVIGLTAKKNAPLGNGASGVAILGGSGSDVEDNTIGFNGHYGVAVCPNASAVGIYRNSIYGNAGLAVDWGIDGVSRFNDDRSTGMPEITLVHLDPDGTANIEIMPGPCVGIRTITVYANVEPDASGYGEGQYFLGYAIPPQRNDVAYVYRYKPDARGRWITATQSCYYYYGFPAKGQANSDFKYIAQTTSEFSRAVQVP